jgi:hypothetical protein
VLNLKDCCIAEARRRAQDFSLLDLARCVLLFQRRHRWTRGAQHAAQRAAEGAGCRAGGCGDGGAGARRAAFVEGLQARRDEFLARAEGAGGAEPAGRVGVHETEEEGAHWIGMEGGADAVGKGQAGAVEGRALLAAGALLWALLVLARAWLALPGECVGWAC